MRDLPTLLDRDASPRLRALGGALVPLVLVVVSALWALAAVRAYVPDGLGYDAHAYWQALRVDEPYGAPPGERDAYLYSPFFLQLITPIAWLPWAVFLTLWTGLEIGCLVWLTWSLPLRWRVSVLLLCAPEILFGNIYGLLGVMVCLGFRRPGFWAFAFLTKVTIGLVGLVWFLGRREWSSAAWVIGWTVLLACLSAALEPELWVQWVGFLVGNSDSGSQVWRVVRLAVGLAVVYLGARQDRRWVLPVGLLLAAPHLELKNKDPAVLAATPRLTRRARGAGTDWGCPGWFPHHRRQDCVSGATGFCEPLPGRGPALHDEFMTVRLAPAGLPPVRGVNELLRLTGCALDRIVGIALDDDRRSACRQGRDLARRRAVRAIQDSIRHAGAHHVADSSNLRRVIERLQFLEELVLLNELLDSLAALVARDAVRELSAADRCDLELLRHTGGQRLRCLADGALGPAMDTDYRQCGEHLLTVVEDLTMGRDLSGAGAELQLLCSEVAGAVLAVSAVQHGSGKPLLLDAILTPRCGLLRHARDSVEVMGIVHNAVYNEDGRKLEPETLEVTYELLRDRHGMGWIGL
ncbi:glycosyltransferase family 87 protein [Nocardioides houyundeii]|uniref:glycosyltransferase family 87 protein n=1 Tax=Nocardioides houyundeii TaxID=2045452 RepID=UPI001F52D662|nr:glycosyltransferase family 87 protein [Nocardioides houyundeii]